MTDARQLGERLRLSRERLAASELDSTTRAWRLWAACVAATAGYTRAADQTYAVTLANAANIKRQVASQLLRQFNELGVFQWEEPSHPGSRDARTLELPVLDPTGTHSGSANERSGTQSGAVSSAPQGPRVGPLQSNTQDVESSEYHRSRGNAGATERVDEKPGTPSFSAMLEALSIEELQTGLARYGPAVADIYAAELERRNVAPRRRPAWLDH